MLSLPSFRSPLLRVFTLLAAGCLLLSSGNAAEAVRKSFDIPAEAADVAIKRFSEQSGLEVFYASNVTEGVRTSAVKGEMTSREALDAMLADTGLMVVQDEKTGAVSLKKAVSPNAPRTASLPSDGRPSPATEAGSGVVEGRIFDEITGNYLRNARVTVVGHGGVSLTDQFGNFRLVGVPAGSQRVEAFYTGYSVQTKTIEVAAEGRSQVDFTFGGASTETTLQLDKFTVAAPKYMTGEATAINEQRFAQNVKTVVAAGSFGDNSDGNLGEFVKYLPGVTLGFTGGQASTISIGGLPPESTPITVDGNRIASAAGETRAIQLDQISLNNMSLVEVERSQNADSPADAIGGSVNLVAKSAFERKDAAYTLKAYAVFRDKALSDSTYTLHPSFEGSAVVPLNDRIGFAISGTSSIQDSAQYISNMAWVPTTLQPTANLPAATPANPYLGRYQYGDAPKTVTRQSGAFSFDLRLTPRDVITIAEQYGYFKEDLNGVPRDQVIVNPVRVVASSPTSVQGADGAGTLQLSYSTRAVSGTTSMPSFRWRHTGPVWKWEANTAYSRSSYHDKSIGKGYFGPLNAYVRNVTVRFDEVEYLKPGTVTVTNAAGQPLDPSNLDNYLLESGGSAELDRKDAILSGSFFAQRELSLFIPIRVKFGADVRSQERDIKPANTNFTFVGADGIARTADDSVAQWIDTSYLDRDEPWDLPQRAGFDSAKVYQTYLAHPSYFRVTETDAVNAYRADVTGSKNLKEDIYAGYLRLDARDLFQGRLNVTGGVRYEQTENEGIGPLINPSLVYQRDAAGNIVRDGAGQPVVQAPLATLAGTQLAYVKRGATTSRSYGDLFPSANLSYQFRPNLIGRLAYSRSIARPNFNHILPSISIPDETSPTARTITLTNPNLNPWTANSYSASLEYYFGDTAPGVFSVRGYQRDISDFWGAVTTPVTPEFLEAYGLDPAIYGANGYVVSTRTNTGDAKVSGFEIDYRQNLSFLPSWGKNTSIFANYTKQDLVGSTIADFTNFVEQTINYGISYNYARLTARVGVNLRGRERRELFTAAGVEAGTYNYMAPRTTVDASAEYRFYRWFTGYVSVRNLFDAPEDRQRYGPSTPDYAKLQIRTDYRPLWVIGVKGTF